MIRSFYFVLAAQFFSSLADNALLILAISILRTLGAPADLEPSLRSFFVVSYVLLAAFVGPFADAFPKGRVMFFTNALKLLGCIFMWLATQYALFDWDPWWGVVLSYGLVGIGAAAYSPAKYGIITEIVAPSRLVFANGWIESLTVLSIILGTVLGGVLVKEEFIHYLLLFDFPLIDTGIDTPIESSMTIVICFYILAAIINLKIADTGKRYPHTKHVIPMLKEFYACVILLAKDKLGQMSLLITTLFWGAGATLQFIVIKWAEIHLGMPLSKASMLQGIVAIGVAVGAVMAARYIPLRRSPSVLMVGIVMGLLLPGMNFIHSLPFAMPLLVAIGMVSGFFVVPMNALLQHRGCLLMGAGRSIAVQNFCENLGILFMLQVYGKMVSANFSIQLIIWLFSLLIVSIVYCIMQLNKKRALDPSYYAGIKD